MNGKYIALLIFPVFFITSCVKDPQEIEYSESIFTYNILLDQDLKVHHVEKIGNNIFFDRYSMHYSDSIIKVEKIIYDSISINFIYYYIENGRVHHSIDSSFSSTFRLHEIHKGEYVYDENGYLLELYKIREGYYPDGSIEFTYYSSESYTYTNANRTKVTKFDDCEAYFNYSTIEKKMDLEYYLQDYLGTMDQNEVSAYTSDCVAFTFYPAEISYTLNSEGLVSQKLTKSRLNAAKVKLETSIYNYEFQ